MKRCWSPSLRRERRSLLAAALLFLAAVLLCLPPPFTPIPMPPWPARLPSSGRRALLWDPAVACVLFLVYDKKKREKGRSCGMTARKEAFIRFMMGADVLRFGEFKTKSGRLTPYFINTGNYRTGAQLAALGRFTLSWSGTPAAAIFDALFGPAYKGHPAGGGNGCFPGHRFRRGQTLFLQP